MTNATPKRDLLLREVCECDTCTVGFPCTFDCDIDGTECEACHFASEVEKDLEFERMCAEGSV